MWYLVYHKMIIKVYNNNEIRHAKDGIKSSFWTREISQNYLIDKSVLRKDLK